MIKSAAQYLLFAIVHEAFCKDTVKKGVYSCHLMFNNPFVFDPCQVVFFPGFLNSDMQFSCTLMINFSDAQEGLIYNQ